MPVVLVARLIGIIFARMKALGWLAQWAPAVAWVVEKVYDGDLKKDIFQAVVDEAYSKAGLELNPDDPFSDASLASAVGGRLGVTIRSLKNRDLIIEDLENYALQLMQERTGYQISSLRDVEIVRADLTRIAVQIISDRVGIPFALEGGQFDPDQVRGQVLVWAKAELLANVGSAAGFGVEEIISAGGLEAVAADLNSRLQQMGSIESITAQQLAVKVAAQLAAGAVADFGKVAAGLGKKSRKRELNRAAQAKFRRTHGSRQRYVPLGSGVDGGYAQ